MRPAVARLTVAVALAGVGALAGCGGGGSSNGSIPKNADPRTEFLAALTNASHTDTLTSTFRFQTTAATLLAFAKATTAPGDDQPTAQQAQELVDGSIVVESKSADGKQLSAAAPGFGPDIDSSIRLTEKGKTDAEIRKVGSTVFLQADLKSLIALGGKPSVYDNIAAQVKGMPAFAHDFVAGKFVSIDVATMKTLASELGGALGVQTPTPEALQKFATTLKADIGRDVTVVKQGSTDKGDHLVLSSNSRTLVKDLLAAVADVEPQLAPKIGADANAAKVPDKTVTLDAYVKDGKLGELSLDITQFSDPGQVPPTMHIPLTMTLDNSGDSIDKPSGATPVDVSQLFTMFAQLGGK